MILEYAHRGELYRELRKTGHLTEKQAATYIVSLAQALAYCHEKDAIHRDIKPENLLLDHEGCLKTAYFGWSVQSTSKRHIMCGTLDYLAAEMLENKAHNYAVDNWTLGILCYEFLYGVPPFEAESQTGTFRSMECNSSNINLICLEPFSSSVHIQQEDMSELRTKIAGIMKVDISFPSTSQVSAEAKNLISRLLVKDSSKRLSLQKIMEHPSMIFRSGLKSMTPRNQYSCILKYIGQFGLIRRPNCFMRNLDCLKKKDGHRKKVEVEGKSAKNCSQEMIFTPLITHGFLGTVIKAATNLALFRNKTMGQVRYKVEKHKWKVDKMDTKMNVVLRRLNLPIPHFHHGRTLSVVIHDHHHHQRTLIGGGGNSGDGNGGGGNGRIGGVESRHWLG
ncbi:unnamed protein product [Camellia sinensis]